MKRVVVFLFIIISLKSLSQEIPDSLYQRADTLLAKYLAGIITPQQTREIKSITYQIQSKGFSLQENSHDYKHSLEYIDKALTIWIHLNDTANQANLYKYRGLLLGYLREYAKAKIEISRSMQLYSIKGIDFGIAVAKFDLSRVFDLEGKLDSALYYANEAMQFWRIKADTSRIFIINNQLMNLSYKMKDFRTARSIQEESQIYSEREKMSWVNLIDFYLLSYKIFNKLKIEKLAVNYKDLYDRKIKDLKNEEHIDAKSNYEYR